MHNILKPGAYSIPSLWSFAGHLNWDILLQRIYPEGDVLKVLITSTNFLIVCGKTYDAVKVKLTMDNFLLAKLWFRTSDDLFLRYEGNSDPGTPDTVIELDE